MTDPVVYSLDLEVIEDQIRRGEAWPGEWHHALVAEVRLLRRGLQCVRDMAQAAINDEDAAGPSVSTHRAAVNAYELLRRIDGPPAASYTRCGSCGGLGVTFPLGPTTGENPPCESCGGKGRHFT